MKKQKTKNSDAPVVGAMLVFILAFVFLGIYPLTLDIEMTASTLLWSVMCLGVALGFSILIKPNRKK